MRRHRFLLTLLLLVQAFIGTETMGITAEASTGNSQAVWLTWLIILPLLLIGLQWTGWTWTAMACVIYGTIGLALDLATVTSMLSGKSEPDTLLRWSGVSGLANLSLIVVGGLTFFQALQGPPPQESRPPSPPSPSSAAAP